MNVMMVRRLRVTMIAGAVLVSGLAPVSVTARTTMPTETVDSIAEESQAVLLIRSSRAQRNPDLTWTVQATLVSNCVPDPGIRSCGVPHLMLLYTFRAGGGPETGWETKELEAPLDDATFQMSSTTISYKFYAWQEVCGPLGCGKAETSDPLGGGNYAP